MPSRDNRPARRLTRRPARRSSAAPCPRSPPSPPASAPPAPRTPHGACPKAAAPSPRGSIPRPVLPLRGGEERQLGEPRLRRRGQGAGQCREMAEQADRGHRVEQVAAELQEDREIRPALDQLQGEVELGRTLGRGQAAERSERETRQLAPPRPACRAAGTSPGRAASGRGSARAPAPRPAARTAGPGGRRRRAPPRAPRRSSSRKVGIAAAGRPRSTRVLTKKPISPSSSARLRLATGVPTTRSSCAGQRCSRASKAASEGHEQRRAGRRPAPRAPRRQLRGERRAAGAAAEALHGRARPVGRQIAARPARRRARSRQ